MEHYHCTNTDGSYMCTCDAGYSGDTSCHSKAKLGVLQPLKQNMMFSLPVTCLISQISMSVQWVWFLVLRMLNVWILMGVMSAYAALDTLRMELLVQVSSLHIYGVLNSCKALWISFHRHSHVF